MPNVLIKEIVAPICIVIGAFLLYFILSKTVRRLLLARFHQVDPRKGKTLTSLLNSILKYFIGIIALLMILDVFGIDTKSLLASLGVLALVVGLALQDILKDFISGMFIIVENQYAIGDTVTVNGFKGEVVSLGLKTTKIKSGSGDLKTLSNRLITEVINHSLEDSVALAEVRLSNNTDLTKLDSVLEEVRLHLDEVLENTTGKVELLGIDEIGVTGMLVKLSVATKATMQSEVRRKMLRELKIAFEKHHIELSIPQMEVHRG